MTRKFIHPAVATGAAVAVAVMMTAAASDSPAAAYLQAIGIAGC
jgi:hypothetical protein